jgi:hypothetical protein
MVDGEVDDDLVENGPRKLEPCKLCQLIDTRNARRVPTCLIIGIKGLPNEY